MEELCAAENPLVDDVNSRLPIFEYLLDNQLLARLILDYVPFRDLVRSERVCRRWQGVVYNHLRAYYRNLCFCDVFSKHPETDAEYTNNYRCDRQISLKDYTLQLACNTLNKFSASLVKIITERNDEAYLAIIASECIHLRQIEMLIVPKCNFPMESIKQFNGLQQISLDYRYARGLKRTSIDNRLAKLLKKFTCEKLEITYCDGLTGRFLKLISAKNLKSLNLSHCFELKFSNLLPAKNTLRKLTSLTLNYMDVSIYEKGPLLLQEMWLLEELSLYDHCGWCSMLYIPFIAALSRLANLKRLYMCGNWIVNDALLVALAQGCTKLEHLDIRGCLIYRCDQEFDFGYGARLTARGVEALCRRSPAAVTTLHFGYIKCVENDVNFMARIIKRFRSLEFESRCGVELTPQWLEAACRGSWGQKVPLELTPNWCPRTEDAKQELRILLCNDLKRYKTEALSTE